MDAVQHPPNCLGKCGERLLLTISRSFIARHVCGSTSKMQFGCIQENFVTRCLAQAGGKACAPMPSLNGRLAAQGQGLFESPPQATLVPHRPGGLLSPVPEERAVDVSAGTAAVSPPHPHPVIVPQQLFGDQKFSMVCTHLQLVMFYFPLICKSSSAP